MLIVIHICVNKKGDENNISYFKLTIFRKIMLAKKKNFPVRKNI